MGWVGCGGEKGERSTNHVPGLSRAARIDEGYLLAGAILEVVGGVRCTGHKSWEGICINRFYNSWVGGCYSYSSKG